MDQTKLALLDAHDWEPTITRLTAYVIMICRFRRYRLPVHLQPEDIVVDAIDKVYSGERNWEPSRDADLGKYMASVVKSMMSNLIESKQLPTTDLDSATVAEEVQSYHSLEYEDLNKRIVEAVRNEPDLALIFKALKEGFRPREIAEEYHLDIRIVNNAQKRLRTLVTRLIEQP